MDSSFVLAATGGVGWAILTTNTVLLHELFDHGICANEWNNSNNNLLHNPLLGFGNKTCFALLSGQGVDQTGRDDGRVIQIADRH